MNLPKMHETLTQILFVQANDALTLYRDHKISNTNAAYSTEKERDLEYALYNLYIGLFTALFESSCAVIEGKVLFSFEYTHTWNMMEKIMDIPKEESRYANLPRPPKFTK